MPPPSTTDELEPFDPEWLQTEQAMGGRQVFPVEPAPQARQHFDDLFAQLAAILPAPTAAVTAVDTTVPSTGLRVRIYTPVAASNTPRPLPVAMYIHSGGWYSGSIEHEDHLARDICEHSNVIVFSPEYRLAPEHPYPTGHRDVYAAYAYMVEHAGEHGGDRARRFVMGGSAGGNLAASVMFRFARDPARRAHGGVIACAGVVHTDVLRSRYQDRYDEARYRDAPLVSTELLRQAWMWLAAPPDDPLASVLLNEDFESLPPVYIAATTKDPTHAETMLFAEKCRTAGVDVDVVEWKGFPHFFHVVPSPTSAKFMRVWNEKLTSMIDKASVEDAKP